MVAQGNEYMRLGNVFRAIGMEEEARYYYRLAKIEYRAAGIEV